MKSSNRPLILLAVVAGAAVLLSLFVSALTSCADTGAVSWGSQPCQPASVVARQHGTVLECYQRKAVDDVEIVDVCLIASKDGGHPHEKVITSRHCGL